MRVVGYSSASSSRCSGVMYRGCCSPVLEHSQHSVSFDSQYTSQRSQYIGGSHRGCISRCCVRCVCLLCILCGGIRRGIWVCFWVVCLTRCVFVWLCF